MRLRPVKRGAHLALTLERIRPASLRPAAAEPQRIGLSATQRPLAEVARFLAVPRRPVTVLDAAHAPDLDLRIEVPVESMAQPAEDEGVSVEPARRAARTRAARSGPRSTPSCSSRCADTARRSSS